MTFDLGIIPLTISLGRAKDREPSKVSTSGLDSKDFAILCLSLSLLFAAMALVFVAARR